jgi:hypothetical protein
MRSAAAALIVFSGQVLAHPGHGAVEGHFHGLSIEYVLLIAVVVAFLTYAVKKK